MTAPIRQFAFAGDLFLGSSATPETFREIARQLGAEMRMIVNFEGTLHRDLDQLNPARHKILLDSPLRVLDALRALPIALVSVGNNHVGDYGNKVADFTLNGLSQNFLVFGAGLDREEFHLKTLQEFGVNIGFANYCTADTSPLFCSDLRIGPRSLNLRNVPGDLCRLKSTSRYCVALIHWGEEDYYHPRPAHLSLGRKLIDLGFDLVIGHHPHSAQGFEQYRERWIFYSLGNFFFADHSTSIDGRRYSVKWMPRRSWGLVPIFRATDDALELVEVKIVRSSRRGMPKFVTGGYLRRKLGRLSNDLAAENYWRCYRKWSAREALQIRFEEFLNNENKLRTIMRKAAERFPIGVQRT